MKMESLDPMLGAPARVAILATLADGRLWSFSELKEETGLADGNLHVQSRKLLDAGLATAEKMVRGRRRVTCYRMTPEGRELLAAYVRRLSRALGADGEKPDLPQPGRKQTPLKDDGSRVW